MRVLFDQLWSRKAFDSELRRQMERCSQDLNFHGYYFEFIISIPLAIVLQSIRLFKSLYHQHQNYTTIHLKTLCAETSQVQPTRESHFIGRYDVSIRFRPACLILLPTRWQLLWFSCFHQQTTTLFFPIFEKFLTNSLHQRCGLRSRHNIHKCHNILHDNHVCKIICITQIYRS